MPPFPWADSVPTLEGSRVHLRAIRDTDAAALFEVFSDPDVMRYRDGVRMRALGDADAYVTAVHDYFRRRELFEWAIADGATDRAIGTCTLVHVDERHRRAEIGFAIGRAHWGRGMAREAVARLLAFAFDRLDLHRLEAEVDPRNERSLRLMERLGFQREGLRRERYLDEDGMQDAVAFALLRRD